MKKALRAILAATTLLWPGASFVRIPVMEGRHSD